MGETHYSSDDNSAWGVQKFIDYYPNAKQWVYIRVQKTIITEYEDSNNPGETTKYLQYLHWSYFYDLKWNYPAIVRTIDGVIFTGAPKFEAYSSPVRIAGHRTISYGGSGMLEGDDWSNNVTSLFISDLSSAPDGVTVWKNDERIFQEYRYPDSSQYLSKIEYYEIKDIEMGGYYADIATANAWGIDNNDKLYNSSLPEPLIYNKADREPWEWYIDSWHRIVNGLIPKRLIPEDELIPHERPEPICLYDVHEPQNGFTSNGLAVLMPYEVISTKEDKGRWDITGKHPIDKFGKWTYILGQNLIKVRGQIFRIDETEIIADSKSEYIAFHANHITYDLKDFWIEDAEFTVSGGDNYIGEVWSHRIKDFPNQQHMIGDYDFAVTSDLEGNMTAKITDQSYIEALFGADNSLVSRYGGEVYRNNFYMSINRTMEHAPEGNAFAIRYGSNMTKVSFKIDMSGWITNLVCVDNYGNFWAVWWDTAGGEWICHHHKTKRVHFTYDTDLYEQGMDRLVADGSALWKTVSTPQISIEVSVANIIMDPQYIDFVNLQNFDVGYQGLVYVEHLGINVSMKITSIKRNELTGEVISIKLGSVRGSLIRQTVMSQTIVDPNSVEGKNAVNNAKLQQELEEAYMKIMSSSISGMMTFTINQLEEHTIDELEGN